MSKLSSCAACGGLVPARVLTCPHCDASVVTKPSLVGRVAQGLLAVTSGSALSITLMACYGAPTCDESEDLDGDGYGSTGCGMGLDCDDEDAERHPDADDTEGDGIDQNCDGVDGVAEEDDAGTDGDAGTDDDAGVAADGG